MRALLLLLALAPPALAQGRPTVREYEAASAVGNKHSKAGDWPAALKAFQHAAALARGIYGPGSWQASAQSLNVALAYSQLEQYHLAEPLIRAHADALLAHYNSGRGEVGLTIVAFAQRTAGDFYGRLGQYPESIRRFRTALKAYQLRIPDKDVTAGAHLNLSNMLKSAGLLEEALQQAEAGLAHRTRHLDVRYEEYWLAKTRVGEALYDLKRYQEAAAIFDEELAYHDKRWGKDRYNGRMFRAAKGAIVLGDFARADDLMTRAARVSARVWGEGSEDTAAANTYLATVRAYRKEGRQALALLGKALPIRRAYHLGIAAQVAEADQVAALMDFTGERLSDALSVGYAMRSLPSANAEAAEWVANLKNLAFEATAERTLLTRDALLPGMSRAALGLRAARKALADQRALLDGSPEAQNRYDQLAEKEQDAANALVRAGGHAGGSRWTKLDDVRKGIPAGEVLVEVKRVDLRDFDDKGGPGGLKTEARYLAWVVPAAGEGKAKAIDLGAAEAVESGCSQLGGNIKSFGLAIDEYNEGVQAIAAAKLSPAEQEKRFRPIADKYAATKAALAKSFREDSAKLSRTLLDPLAEAAGKSRSWIVSPDGPLWLLPWAALVTKDGKWLAESVTLRQVVSGRDLVPGPALDPKAQSAPLVLADPDYDLGLAGPADPARIRRDTRLEITSREADGLKKPLKDLSGKDAVVKLRGEATEEEMKKAKSPRYLVLATHGTFGDMAESDVRTMPPSILLARYINPMLRCKLIFAGCNRRGGPPGGTEDGVLYGIEILGLDLRHTELVWMSACETARGDTNAGQAAAGLRQAFQLAGARAVVGTLWSVFTRESAILSNRIFARRAAGDSEAAALAWAMRARLADDKTLHPYHWASHTLTTRGK